MAAPVRIQRRRTKGWKMPPDTVNVSRPGLYGNPFDWQHFGREGAVDLFRAWLADGLTAEERLSTGIDIPNRERADWQRAKILAGLPDLRGKNLACWCKVAPDVPCHADVLLELANVKK